MSRVLRQSLYLDCPPQTVRGRCGGGFPAQAAPTPNATIQRSGDDIAPVADEPPQATVSEELRMLLGSLEESVQEAEQIRRQSLAEFQQLAVELAVTIAGELVFRAIDADHFDVGGLVNAAVARLGLDAPLSVAMHPADVQLLKSQETEEPPLWQTGTLSLCPDATLPRGHCRATNGATVLLSEFAPRLEEIRDSLLEGLDDAQIERRKAAGIGSALKRFPDRRETA